MTTILEKHRKKWANKKILREIYHQWYKKIEKDLTGGKILEIGSGIGNFKNYKPEIIASDIEDQPWLDMHFDGHIIPFKNNSLGNIVLIDTLHHLSNPVQFLSEAARVLKHHGRIILLEPFPTLFSLQVYRIFHPEPFNFGVDYFSNLDNRIKKNPWESNQAIPYLIFFKNQHNFVKKFPNLKIKKIEKLSFILYPLSGGFENRQLIPDNFIPVIRLFEKLLSPFRFLLAFRCYIVIEKVN